MAKWHVWNNGGDSEGPHNWRFDSRYIEALRPQNKKMNDEHLRELVQEWKLKHPYNFSGINPIQDAAGKALWDKNALEWAKKNEPRRYLNPLLRPINGIKADEGLRRLGGHAGDTAVLSSSWVGDAKFPAAYTVNPSTVTFDLGGKDYTFKLNEIGGYKGLEECLSSPSIGSYIAKNWIGKLPSSRAKWKTGSNGEPKMPSWLKSFNKRMKV